MIESLSQSMAPTTPEEHCIFQYFLQAVEVDSTEVLIERFYKLFFEGNAQSNPDVENALERLVSGLIDELAYSYLLNRCFHILINRWLMLPGKQRPISTLIKGFTDVPTFTQLDSLTVRRLRYRAQQFLEGELYASLRRLCQVVQPMPSKPKTGNQPLVKWVSYYPYLYEHTILTQESTDDERQQVLTMRVEAQRCLRRDLIRFSTRQWSRQAIYNPTRLSDQQLDLAIHRFTHKVNGKQTHRDLAQQFYTYSQTADSFGQFKRDLYSYITASVNSHYGRGSFCRRLSDCLHSILPECDGQQNSDFLTVTACHQVLNFLVVENSSSRDHSNFVDLIGNLGSLNTVSLLVKIVLFCKMTRLHLERQFSLLFRHYETSRVNNVKWLVECFENLNVALGLYLQV